MPGTLKNFTIAVYEKIQGGVIITSKNRDFQQAQLKAVVSLETKIDPAMAIIPGKITALPSKTNTRGVITVDKEETGFFWKDIFFWDRQLPSPCTLPIGTKVKF